LQVIEVDTENESAWLWLSSVVENEADQRVCLENVLAVNPDNAAAWRKLDALDNLEVLPGQAPSGLAIIEFQHEETFVDVWSSQVDICGYCATPIKSGSNRCPGCKRNLLVKTHRYTEPTSNLTAVWASLICLALLYVVQFGYSQVFSDDILYALSAGFVVVLLAGTAVGFFFRKSWAYTLAIIILILIIVTGLIQLLFSADLTPIKLFSVDSAISGVLEPITNAVWVGMKVVQVIAAAIILVFVFRANGDFERVQYLQIAVPSRNMKRGIEFHLAARKLAKAGLWATAVKNWQRAVALEPNRIIFQQHLGQAYAQLGFTERSLDVLQSAKARTKNKEVISELDTLIQSVQNNQKLTSSKH
jgi:hypothetical protein